MKPRTFNSVMHFTNERWAARVLNMNVNPGNGPDLIDDDKVVEVKFKLIYPERYTHTSWRVLQYQMNYPQEFGRTGYWALGTYSLNTSVSAMRKASLTKIENYVVSRELWIVDWNWMKQFPFYRQEGKTEISEWDNTLAFPKKRLLPKSIDSFVVDKGKVHFTDGVDPTEFGF